MSKWYPGVPFHKRAWAVAKRADYLEVAFLVFFMFSGLVQLVSGERPGSVAELIPGAWDLIWIWMLTIGAITALVGNFWLWDRTDSILLESLGDLAVGVAVFLYGTSALVFGIWLDAPGAILMSGPVIMLLGFGWIWKWRVLNRLLNELKAEG